MKKLIGGNMKGIKLLLVATAASLVACGGGGGGSSAPSTQQATPKPDQLSATVAKTAFASSEACPQGGVTIDQGIDANRNGVLDPDEIFETQQVCNGVDGGDGVASLIRVDEIGAGAQCTYGGLKVSVGLDASDNGVLDPAEVSQTSYVCSVTASQTDGFSSLLDMEGEAAGTNCTAGGQKITSGLDFNRNGALDFDEVTQIKYICNGDTPVVYQTLINTSNVASNAQCPNGGVQIDVGLDVDQSLILESDEITGTSYLCNGEDGDGNISLVRVESEAPGANCSAGGKAIHTGIDSNQNLVLDSLEVMSTSYVCNGEDGLDGQGSSVFSYYAIRTTYEGVQQIVCAADDYGITYKSAFYDLASEGLGEPYQTCYQESCTKRIANGSRYETKSYGDGDCTQYHYITQSCSTGFEWNGNSCESIEPLPPQCLEGEVNTSRGCEVEVVSCPSQMKLEDNQCVDIEYVSVTGNVCGEYADPVKITSGQHFVTCDTTFNERLFVEAGATLQVDRDWFIKANNGVEVNGNSVSPVIIETSPNNLDGLWNSFSFSGDVALDYSAAQPIGDSISFLMVDGFNNTSSISGVALSDTSVVATAGLNLQSVISDNSTYDTGTTTVRNSLIQNSAFIGDSPSIYGGVVINSSVSSDGYLRVSVGSTYSQKLGLIRSALLFNPVLNDVWCLSGSYVQGNGTVSYYFVPDDCNESDNLTPISDKLAAYILGSEKRTVNAESTISLEAYIFDKNGLVQPTEIIWKARYDVDGTYYDSGQTWTGRKVDISLSQKEQYEVYVESVNGQTDLLGPKSIILNVQ